MKKSIFLFFAAILCAIGMNAKVIYLNAGGSSLWDQAGAVFTAKVSTTEYPMTKVFGSYYEGTVPDDATKVTFMRNAPAGSNWDKTSQLSIPTDGKNCYNITRWSSGNWSTYPPTFYIAGDFITPNWSENATANKMDYADGVYSKSYNNVAASAHQFKITNGTWTNAIGYDKNTCSGTNCTVEDGGGNIKFTPLAEGSVTITYTIADGKIHITCPEPPAAEFNITYPATQTNYTLVAGPAKAQTGAEVSFTATPAEGYVLNVTYNGNAITGNNNVYTFMMPAADVTIAITAVAATTLYYVDNSKWGNANAYMWNDHGNNGWPGAAMALVGTVGDDAYSYYSISFAQGAYTSIIFNNGNGSQTADLTINAAKPYFYDGAWYTWDELLAKLAAPVVKTYTVVGSSAPLFGEAWATGKTENDMTLVEGTKYELVKSDIALTAGEILYKVAVNHAWDEAYPGENAKLTISEAGKYTVTFTFDSNTKAVDVIAELTEAAVVLPTIKVKGAWDAWTANTTLAGDNTSASATVNIATAGIYEFGLDVDGNFQASGATIDKANNSTVVTTNAGNMKLTANVLGDYTFTWTYETNTLTVTYPAGEEVEIAKKYYIAGTQNLTGFDWKENGLEIAKDGDVYKHTFTELNAGEYEFKITDGTWTNQWNYNNLGAAYEEVSQGVDGEGNPNGNIKIVTEEAKNITVIFDATAGKITFEGLTEIVATELVYKVTVPAGTPNCYIVFGDAWDAENAPAMTKVDDTHYTYTRTGLKSDQYKYLYGQSWDFVEVRADNRTWAEEDVVENWNNPYTEVRTALTAGNYYTICMTKEMKQVKGATLWSFCGKDANFAYLVQEDAPYTAGKAYIMYAEAETVSAILTGEPALAPVANGAIHGTFGPEPMDQAALDAAATAAGSDIYLVIGNQLRLVNGQTNNSLPANRAYVVIDEIPVGAPAGIPANRVRSMPMQPQVATGMESVDASAQPVKMIIDGQLYILRGEKMYDAQGKLVK